MNLLLLGLLILNSASAPAAPLTPAALVDRELAKLQALYSDGLGSNSPKARHVVFGSLFDTDRQDAIAFFPTVEVDLTNVHYEYIAVSAQGDGRDLSGAGGPKERPYHLVAAAMVGSRWTRTLDWQSATIGKGQIVVQGTRWAEHDAQLPRPAGKPVKKK